MVVKMVKEVVESLESSHQRKIAAKRDLSVDEIVKKWMIDLLPELNIQTESSLFDLLKDGTILCQ